MLRVLIIANESDFARSLRLGIKQHKHTKVIGTISKPIMEIADAIQKNNINLIFLDIHFLGISTQSFITKITEQFPELKIVYIGHIEDSQYLNTFAQMNGIGVLIRPIRQVDILKILDNAEVYYKNIEDKEKLLEELKKQASADKSLFENKFLTSLVKGEIGVRSEIMQSLMYYETNLHVDRGVRVAVLRIDGFRKLALTFETDVDKHALVEYVKSTMEVAFSTLPSVVMITSLNQFVLIANNSEDQEAFLTLCDKIRDTINEEFGIKISMGVGKYYEDFYDLALSYREAVDALRYRYQLGYNTILPIENITINENLYNRISIERKEKLIFATIVCEKDSVERLINEIFADLSKSESVTIDFLSMWVISILIEVGIVAQAQGIDIQQYIKMICDFEKTSRFQNIADAQVYLMQALDLVCNEILILTKRTEEDIYVSTKQYAENNYMFPFSIKKISSIVGASPERINTIFKERENNNIHDYIIEKRIEVAKHLLLTTQLDVEAVAVNVGYSSGAYFESLFRQMTNVSTEIFRYNNRNNL